MDKDGLWTCCGLWTNVASSGNDEKIPKKYDKCLVHVIWTGRRVSKLGVEC